MRSTLPTLVTILVLGCTMAIESDTSVARHLYECYNTTELRERDFRLPSTINILIDLIRQVEDSSKQNDARTLAIQLIHRFRQDGIFHTSVNSPLVLPYTPRGPQRYKNKIILNQLVPGDALQFPNGSLTPPELCGLHFMLSNSLDREVRKDEDEVCKYTMQYRRRVRRANNQTTTREFLEDPMVERSFGNHEFSDCPVENGVVYTRWGEIQAGTVLTAIAAGLEPQSYNLRDVDSTVDSRYAVTLAGDLVEVALHEGVTRNSFTIGAPGGWKNILSPHWYYVNSKEMVHLTNPELRADIDGLILALNIRDWMNSYRNLKISQLLDMYYSNRGVFSSSLKACNRNKEISKYTSSDKLLKETKAFAYLYDQETTLAGTLVKENIDSLVQTTLQHYDNSISRIADVQCLDEWDRTATDLIIVLDTSWDYENIYPSLSYLLDNLDINKYESSYTMINAKDGTVLVNLTNSLSRFHQEYNKTTHDQSSHGFDVYGFMDTIEQINRDRVEKWNQDSKMSGKSSTVLFVPRSADDTQAGYLQGRLTSVFDQYYPDTHFIVLGTGSKESYNSYVRNPATDIFIIPESSNRDSENVVAINLLVQRFQKAPRRIVNPRCNSNMQGDSSSNDMEFYIEPGTTNRYKISRSYLSGEGTKTLVVRASASSKLRVCSTFQVEEPSEFEKPPGVDSDESGCKLLSGSEESFVLNSGEDYYFAVKADKVDKGSNNQRCTDELCRFPDSFKFTLHVEGLTCTTSSGGTILTSLGFVMVSVIIALVH